MQAEDQKLVCLHREFFLRCRLICLKMKLLLAVSVLVIALSVTIESTSAQTVTEAPSTDAETPLEKIGTKIRDAAATVAEKSKAAYDQMKNSEIVRKTQNWFSEKWQNLKDKVSN